MSDQAIDSPTAPKAPAKHATVSHVMPAPLLLAVFAALLGLTFLTVAVTWFDLGGWNLSIAMGIATVKASLVALFFMHLLYDNRFNALLFVASLVFLALFISLTLLDRVQYQTDIDQYQEANAP